MPYIKPEKRKIMDKVVDAMIDAGVEVNGDLNYILCSFASLKTPSYKNYKNFIGELNEAAAEIRRRLLAPYEDKKLEENGDVL